MSKNDKISNDDLIRKIESIDDSVLPDKSEILRRLKENAENEANSTVKSDKNKSKGSSNLLLLIGLFFQFIFTVFGGGMFISGLISGFSVKWDTTIKDGVANISIVLTIVGAIFFAIGIILAFVLYKKSLKAYFRSKIR